MGNLKKNVTYNFVYQLLILFLPFVTAPYLSRVIGASGVGTYSYSYSIALYFTYFTILGLNKYGNRMIAEKQNSMEECSLTFFEIYAMQLLCFIICLLAYIAYIFLIADDKIAAGIQILFVVSAGFDVNWFFFGKEQFKLTIIRNIIIKIATVIFIFLFVKTEADVYKYVAIMASGYLISQICILPMLKRFIRFKIPKFKNVLSHIKPNFVLFVPVIAVSIYRIMDKIMLGSIDTMASVGYYENAEKLINVPVALITAVGTVMLPRTVALISNNQKNESDKYFNKSIFWMLAFSNGAAFGLISVASEFSVLYYGPDFLLTGKIIVMLSITIIFLAIGNVVRTQYLIPYKKDKIYINSAIIGALLNLVVNSICIPRYGAMGAAFGTICAEVIVCAYQIFMIRDRISLKTIFKYELFFLVAAIIMFFVTKVISIGEWSFIDLIMKVAGGGIVYCVFIIAIAKQQRVLSKSQK